jgi:hypothetical protein
MRIITVVIAKAAADSGGTGIRKEPAARHEALLIGMKRA